MIARDCANGKMSDLLRNSMNKNEKCHDLTIMMRLHETTRFFFEENFEFRDPW